MRGLQIFKGGDELEDRAARAGVELEMDVTENMFVRVDPVALRMVVLNLVDNAIKATAAADGGPVSVGARREGRFVRMDVADSGIGFDPGDADKLFEKFYRQGDEMLRKHQGSGLGLYLVRRMVELSRGRVSAQSPGPGRGATFTVLWPAAATEIGH